MVQGDYSLHIREASMAMDGLPEGVSPSGRVPEQLLQAASILTRRRRKDGEGFGRKGCFVKGFRKGGKIKRKGGGGERTHRAARRPPGAAQGGAAPGPLLVAWWWPPFHTLVIPEGSVTLIFYIIFLDFSDHFK